MIVENVVRSIALMNIVVQNSNTAHFMAIL